MHKVIAAVDAGDPILTEIVPILVGDTLEVLQGKIHAVEHQLLVNGVIKILS